MKRNLILLLAASFILTASVFGCGRNNQDDTNENSANESGGDNALTGTEAAAETEHTSQLQLGSAVEVPESFDGHPVEAEAHQELEKAIGDYFELSEDAYASVRYHYNYVDLNGDGKNEILTFVSGAKEEGDGKTALLWLDEADKELLSKGSVRQVFQQTGMPVYISNHMTEGYRDLILPVSRTAADDMADAKDVNAGNAGRTVDGEETSLQRTAGLDETTGENGEMTSTGQTYVLLTWKGDRYQDVEEGTTLFSLEGYEGTAIFTNQTDYGQAGDGAHVLGEAM